MSAHMRKHPTKGGHAVICMQHAGVLYPSHFKVRTKQMLSAENYH